ncbi:JmjC domain-containing protein [Inhella sp.]|uniref:JmjC domain-containing protein n=1 Tax=Inhella sp. TaxID=1921806 RepID=UPI0035B46681
MNPRDQAQFMRRHWQRKPALLRGAAPETAGRIGRSELFALARREDVESRLVQLRGGRWQLRHGPLVRLPAVALGQWTLLVQGVEAHLPVARELMDRYRFLPEARLDDVMVSWAADGGGVGPHVDAYDVFLVQVAGRRRWRVSHQRELGLVDGLPLKILRDFQPEMEWVLEPGDVLYLPPLWAHDGVALGADCITASVGFRAPSRFELAQALLPRLLDSDEDDAPTALRRRYADAGLAPTDRPAEVPAALADFARDSLQRALYQPHALARALGEHLSQPKPHQSFDAAPWQGHELPAAVRLAPGSRMLYDDAHVFLNGESFRAGGRDASLMHELADRRQLDGRRLRLLSEGARELVLQWLEEGWLWPST